MYVHMGCVFYMQSIVVEMAPAHCLAHSFLFLLSEVLKRRFIRLTYSQGIPVGRSFFKNILWKHLLLTLTWYLKDLPLYTNTFCYAQKT